MALSGPSHSVGVADGSSDTMSKPPSPARDLDFDREDEEDAMDAERELDGGNTSYVRGTPPDRERSSPVQNVQSLVQQEDQQQMTTLPSIDTFTEPASSGPSMQSHSRSPTAAFPGNGHGHRSPPPSQSQLYSPSSPSSVPSGLRGLINPYSTEVNHGHRPSSPLEYSRSTRASRRRRGSPPPTYSNGNESHS